jgi:DtxR family Mn-dependent transcriptional regulator
MPTAKDNDLSASLEDYLEAILNLAGESNVARSRDIAAMLGVSKASVTGALRLLKEKGLVNYKPYDYATLTEAGRSAATEVAQKHNILKSFFVDVLGIDKDTAQRAACKAEHALGPQVIARIEHVMETGKFENGSNLTNALKNLHKNKPRRSRKRKSKKVRKK